MDTLQKISKITVFGGLAAVAFAIHMKQPESLINSADQGTVNRVAKFRRCVRSKQIHPDSDVEAGLAAHLKNRFDRASAGEKDLVLQSLIAEVASADYLRDAAEKSCGAEQSTSAAEISAQQRKLEIALGADFTERQIQAAEYRLR